MRVALTLTDWQRGRESVYGILRLHLGDFHRGSTFFAKLVLDPEQVEDLRTSLETGSRPVFALTQILADDRRPTGEDWALIAKWDDLLKDVGIESEEERVQAKVARMIEKMVRGGFIRQLLNARSAVDLLSTLAEDPE